MMFLKVIAVLVFLFPIQNLSAQDIDKALYQKKTRAEFNWDTDVTEYYKFDAVFLGREQYGDDESGNEDFILFELNGDDTSRDSVIIISGANTLPQIKPGQYVTIYCRLFSGSTPNGAPLYVIDHIEFPAENFFFTATHRTIERTSIMFPPGDGAYLTIPVDSGIEVQVLGKFSRDTEENDGKGGLIKGRWMWLVTSDGFGGWVFSPYLEPLPHAANIEIPTNFSFEATHKAIKETTIWENLGREPRTTIDTGVEVQVYETDLDVVTSEGETGSCVYLVTANGYLGYAFAAHFEPLPQTVVVETPPPVVDNESESSVEPEAKWSSGFPLRWVIAGLGAALLVVIIAVVMVKRKKK